MGRCLCLEREAPGPRRVTVQTMTPQETTINTFVHEYALLQVLFWMALLALSIHYVRGAIDKAEGIAVCAIAGIQFGLAITLYLTPYLT